MKFKEGNKAAENKKGKKSEGSGRTPEWFNAKCRELADKCKLAEFWADVMSGKDFKQGVGSEGEVIKIPASIKDRLKASELLADRAYGKVTQPLSSDPNNPIVLKIVNYGAGTNPTP